MKKHGLQTLENVHHHFDKNLGTSAPIMSYYFDKTKPYNPELFKLTAEEQITKNIVEKILAKKSVVGSLTQNAVGNIPEKENTDVVTVLTSVSKDGPVFEDLPKSKARYIENGEDYFFTNMFYGMNSYDHAYKGVGPLYIADKNIYGIGGGANYSEDEFNAVMNLPEVKFLLKYFRQSNTRCLGWTIREIPLIPAGTTSEDNWFDFTQEELELVHAHKKV